MSRFNQMLVAILLALAPAAMAAPEKKVVLGVFLPTVVANGQERFELSEKLGAALEKELGRPVLVKNFGRYEDLAEASKKLLDIAIVETWAGIQLSPSPEVLAAAEIEGDLHQRWAVVSHQKGPVAGLDDRRIAVPRGVKSLTGKFLTNVVFRGDLDTRKFKVVQVPNAESALQMLQAKSVGAAVVPVGQAPKDARVLFRSDRIPGVVAVVLKGNAEGLRPAVLAVKDVAPFNRFVAPPVGDISELKTLLTKGPPPRVPIMADSPVLRPDSTAFVDMGEVGLVLPSFLEHMEAPEHTPDD